MPESVARARARVTIEARVRQPGSREYLPIEGGAPGTVFTSFGETWVIDVLDGLAPGTQYIHWGTGAGVPAKGSTDVSVPASEARVAALRTQVLADKMQWTATLVSDGTKTITNAGLFMSSTGANAIIVGDHAGQALLVGYEIDYTITLEMT